MKKNLLYSLIAAGSLLAGGTIVGIAETTGDPDPSLLFTELGVKPAKGTTVGNISSIELQLPVWNFGENTPDCNINNIQDIKVLKGTEVVASADGIEPFIATSRLMSYTISFPEVKEAGEYTVSIPRGFFYEAKWSDADNAMVKVDGGHVSDKIEISYTIVSDAKPAIQDYVLVPADGSTVSKLDEIIFAFPKLTQAEITKNAGMNITLTNVDDPSKKATVDYSIHLFTQEYMGNGIKINVDPAITESGKWRLDIPEGIVVEDASGAKSPAVSATFTVEAVSAPAMNYTCSPESGSTIDETRISDTNGLTINFNFDENDGLEAGDDPFDYIVVKFDGVVLPKIGTLQITEKEGWAWIDNWGDPAATFRISPKVFTKSGKLEITIPKGALIIDDVENEEINYVLDFKNSKDTEDETPTYTWTADPANNGKIEMPGEQTKFTSFAFEINGADKITYDEWEDPNHDPVFGSQTKTIQVLYNGESVKNVADVNGTTDANIGYQLRNNYGLAEIVLAVNNQVFTKPGILEITIDKGRCTADEKYPTPEIRYTCTVGNVAEEKDYEVKVYPEMDITTLYEIDYFKDGFKIEFTNAKTVVPNMVKDYDDNDKPIMVLEKKPHLEIGSVIYYGSVEITEVKDAECPTFIITYPEMFDIDASLGGTINFSVDKGTFTVDGEYDSPAISQTWKLKRTKEVDTSYIFGPEGDVVNNGEGLYAMISFNIDEFIYLDRSNVVVKFNDEVLKETDDYILTVMNGDNKCIYLEFMTEKYMNPELTGAISIEIPAEAVSVSGVKIGAINHTWNVVLPKTFTYKATGFAPKYKNGPTYNSKDNRELTTDLPKVADLSEIIFEIPDAKTAKLWNKNFINLRSRDYMTYGAHAPEVEEVAGTEHPTFKFKFEDAPVEEDVIYELVFDYGAFYIDGAFENPNLDFAVILDKSNGVDEINTAGNTTYTVVSVDGKVVLSNGTLDQVKALAKGLYIINGKKQIIK